MRPISFPLVAAVTALLLVACAGTAQQPSAQDKALARYSAYAGPPVDRFTWLGHYDGWEPLGKDRLVIFTTTSEAYLLKVWPPCDLRFVVDRIGLTSTSNTVYARLDSVIAGSRRCPIDEIRPIDYRRMKADLRTQAQNPSAAPSPAAPAATSPAEASAPPPRP
jgi:Family of unknown function (DUF6491)